MSLIQKKKLESFKQLLKNTKNTMEVNRDQKLLGYPHVTKILSFVFNKRKNLRQLWNTLRPSKG